MQLNKATVDAAEYKAGFDKAAADAAEFKAGYDKLAVDAVESKAQVCTADAPHGLGMNQHLRHHNISKWPA